MDSSWLHKPASDPTVIENIVNQLKFHGVFDQFRYDCLTDIDTKPSYQNLSQRVDGFVTKFLANEEWNPDLNKNELRNKLRRHIEESEMLSSGVDHVVEQVVNSKAQQVFMPRIREIVEQYLALRQPNVKIELDLAKGYALVTPDVSKIKTEAGLKKSEDSHIQKNDFSTLDILPGSSKPAESQKNLSKPLVKKVDAKPSVIPKPANEGIKKNVENEKEMKPNVIASILPKAKLPDIKKEKSSDESKTKLEVKSQLKDRSKNSAVNSVTPIKSNSKQISDGKNSTQKSVENKTSDSKSDGDNVSKTSSVKSIQPEKQKEKPQEETKVKNGDHKFQDKSKPSSSLKSKSDVAKLKTPGGSDRGKSKDNEKSSVAVSKEKASTSDSSKCNLKGSKATLSSKHSISKGKSSHSLNDSKSSKIKAISEKKVHQKDSQSTSNGASATPSTKDSGEISHKKDTPGKDSSSKKDLGDKDSSSNKDTNNKEALRKKIHSKKLLGSKSVDKAEKQHSHVSSDKKTLSSTDGNHPPKFVKRSDGSKLSSKQTSRSEKSTDKEFHESQKTSEKSGKGSRSITPVDGKSSLKEKVLASSKHSDVSSSLDAVHKHEAVKKKKKVDACRDSKVSESPNKPPSPPPESIQHSSSSSDHSRTPPKSDRKTHKQSSTPRKSPDSEHKDYFNLSVASSDISSVHTSDLSSFEDDISLSASSADEGQPSEGGMKTKKKISLKKAATMYPTIRKLSDQYGLSKSFREDVITAIKEKIQSDPVYESEIEQQPESPSSTMLQMVGEVSERYGLCESLRDEVMTSLSQKFKTSRKSESETEKSIIISKDSAEESKSDTQMSSPKHNGENDVESMESSEPSDSLECTKQQTEITKHTSDENTSNFNGDSKKMTGSDCEESTSSSDHSKETSSVAGFKKQAVEEWAVKGTVAYLKTPRKRSKSSDESSPVSEYEIADVSRKVRPRKRKRRKISETSSTKDKQRLKSVHNGNSSEEDDYDVQPKPSIKMNASEEDSKTDQQNYYTSEVTFNPSKQIVVGYVEAVKRRSQNDEKRLAQKSAKGARSDTKVNELKAKIKVPEMLKEHEKAKVFKQDSPKDVRKTRSKSREQISDCTKTKNNERKSQSQARSTKRYDSSDLYKPRPVIQSSSRRSRAHTPPSSPL